MTPALRPLLAMLALTLVAGSADAAKKPVAPATPAACSDFYGNINATWLRSHPVPAGADGISRWDELRADAAKRSQQLATSPRAAVAGPASTLLADLVASGQDEAAMDAAAQSVLAPLIARVDAIKKPKDIAAAINALQAAGIPVLYDLDVRRDPKTGQPRATFVPNGLTLHDPAFYGSADPELQRIGGVYRAYLADLLKFSGTPGDQLVATTSQALQFEELLAKAGGGNNVQSQSPSAAAKTYSQLGLGGMMSEAGIAPGEVFFEQPEFFKTANTLVTKAPVPQWKAYLRAQLLHSVAPMMTRDYRRIYIGFVDETLAKRTVSQSERVATLVREQAPDLLSAAFSENALTTAQDRKADAIGAAIRAAGKRAVDRATWLGADEKAAANKQLDAMQLGIGKPITPVAFTALKFQRTNYAANVLALRRWQRAREVARMERPIWPWPVSQSSPVIGFEPGENRLIVTAAAMQSPVFSGTSDAADYGALGVLMAQQISTGMHLSPAAEKAWAEHSSPLVAQYNAYTAAGTSKVNGERTQAQNSADLVGLEIAFDALSAAGPVDPAARKAFFASWASVMARNERDAAVIASLPTSTYAPAKWRVNGTVVNHPQFTQAYACKAGQPLYKAAKDQVSLLR